MNIKRCKFRNSEGVKCVRREISMENVLRIDSYTKEIEECEWDSITNIFQSAIERKGLSKEEVNHISDRIIKEVRGNK